MSDTQPAQHPQDPAEGQDFDEQDIESDAESGDESGDDAEEQNQPREIVDGDDALQPGGSEPTD